MTIVDSKVIVDVDADTESARRQFELLRAQQQSFAAEVTKGLESQNKSLEDSISKWAKISVGIGAAVTAFKLAKAGLEEYGKEQELLDATRGVNLQGLREASRGLKTDFELLEIAAKTNAGAFKLTNEQMQLAVKAMEVYEDRGHDAKAVTDAVTEALIKGSAKGLKGFGVQVDEASTKSGQFQAVIRALTKDVKEAGEQTDVGTDAWKRHGVTVENAMSRMKIALGEIVVQLAPIIEVLADWADTASGARLRRIREETEATRARIVEIEADTARMRARFEQDERVTAAGFRAPSALRSELDARTGALIQVGTIGAATAELLKANEKTVKAELARLRREAESESERRRKGVLGAEEGDSYIASLEAMDVASVTRGMRGMDTSGLGGALDKLRAGAAVPPGEEQVSPLARIFGPVEEFDVYVRAWAMLEGAVTTAVDAWIDGSISSGQAVKKFFAESLRGMAIELSVKALREGAEAIASLARYDYPGAALHGKAAAAYTVGAIAAGAGAKLLGAGGGSTVGGAASAAPTTSPGQASQPESRVIIAYGDDFADDSPRKRAQNARKLVARGLGEAGAGVSFS